MPTSSPFKAWPNLMTIWWNTFKIRGDNGNLWDTDSHNANDFALNPICILAFYCIFSL